MSNENKNSGKKSECRKERKQDINAATRESVINNFFTRSAIEIFAPVLALMLPLTVHLYRLAAVVTLVRYFRRL